MRLSNLVNNDTWRHIVDALDTELGAIFEDEQLSQIADKDAEITDLQEQLDDRFKELTDLRERHDKCHEQLTSIKSILK